MNAREPVRQQFMVLLVRRAVAFAATAAAIGAALAAAPAASGHLTQSRVDRTMSCSTSAGALQIIAFPTNPRAGAAGAGISTGPPSSLGEFLVGVDTRYKNYKMSSTCRAVKSHVAFTHRGLTSPAGGSSGTVDCPVPHHILLRFRLGFDSSGKPVTATIAVWTQPSAHTGKRAPKSRPIGFVQWSPQRSVTYYSSACISQ